MTATHAVATATVSALPRVHARAADMRAQLKIVIVGHVDHGKSTLIGRLLYDTGTLSPEKVEELKAVSAKRGVPIEWSFAMDAFQAERDQAVTIDTTQIWFRTAKREYVIIDAPGHREFLKNMISGASLADAAVLVIDASEGVREQSRRHGYLLHLLGIRQVAVVVNKMDLVGYSAARFAELNREITEYLSEIGVVPAFVVPISGRDGDNIATRSGNMAWYDGPAVIEALDRFQPYLAPTDQPLRLPIQDIYKFDKRVYVGRIESGSLNVGDTVLFSPSNKTAVVRSLEAWNVEAAPMAARAGECVGFTLDEQIFVERGEMVSHEDLAPQLTTVFRGTIFWLAHEALAQGRSYRIRLGTREGAVTVQSIDRIIDTDTLAGHEGTSVERNGVAEITLRSREILSLDEYRTLPRTGRFVLLDGFETVGGGVISMEGYPDQRPHLSVKSKNLTQVDHRLGAPARAVRNGHKGGVLWFTGLSGAGKSTLAMEIEQRLFQKGYHVYVLDGDNVRRGLNANLGFSPEDRAENIRRVGEVAALFADSGMICLTAFISPYRADRERARAAAPEAFHEVYIKAGLEACEKRDPKGLYKKARRGEIAEFTGISAPYEPPASPELTIDTEAASVEECVRQALDYVDRCFAIKAAAGAGK
jgi:bifunctional enzyme CysN/CysC